ncbi:MAG: GNAT family N-acetyltransferase [Betaproteobacteria bacterium]|nr:GNAT family N-acetyltransferase [Betaproteobacteria bacterium]
MQTIKLLSWKEAREDAAPIRFEVFVEEQGVPRDIELDEHDETSLHAVAFEDDAAVATGRLLPDGHIGRMAVLAAWRGRGVGSRILLQLIDAARARGDAHVALSAQVQAVPFYRNHGFIEEGEEYLDAGIRHRAMRLELRGRGQASGNS